MRFGPNVRYLAPTGLDLIAEDYRGAEGSAPESEWDQRPATRSGPNLPAVPTRRILPPPRHLPTCPGGTAT